MARELTTDVDAALQASAKTAITLAALDFTSGVVRVTDCPYDVTWDGYTWTGLGRLGSIEMIAEGGDLQARSIKFRLSGIPAAVRSVLLTTYYQGRPAQVWFAAMNPDTHQILEDPVGPFQYRLDSPQISLGQQATIELPAADRVADWDRPRVRRYNDADQQAVYPGDTFCANAEEMVEKTLVW